MLSIITELITLLVIRTRKPFFKSRPAPLLLFSTIGVGAVTLLIPYLPLGKVLNMIPIPAPLLMALLGIAILYLLAIEVGKALVLPYPKAVCPNVGNQTKSNEKQAFGMKNRL